MERERLHSIAKAQTMLTCFDNCEPAILKSYFICRFYLIILPLCDIKITLDSEEKCKLFSWRAQQKKWPIQSLIEKREGKIV